MATSGGFSSEDLRHRSGALRRGEVTYSSLRLRVPSAERPLHVSPDRITRNASPGRKRIMDEQEVVPRIPQPYRTSFSAVTSPRRVPRPANLAPLSRSCPLRSTMPGRFHSPEASRHSNSQHFPASDHSLPPHPTSAEPVRGLPPSGASRRCQSARRQNGGVKMASRSAEDVLSSSHHSGDDRGTPMYNTMYSTPELNINKSLVNGDETVRAFMSVSNGALPTGRTEDSDSFSNTLESTDFTDGGPSPEPQVFTFEVEAKKLIKREYVHVNDISYFKALDRKAKLPAPNDETERLVQDMMKDKKREWRMMSPKSRHHGGHHHHHHHHHHAGFSLPTSPDDSPMGRQHRSGTLPSETLLAGKPMASTPVKRSLSTSITNFFKRMSPKSLRRSSKGSSPKSNKQSATPDSSENSLQAVCCDSADDLSVTSDHSGSQKGKSNKKSPSKASPIRTWLSQSFRKSKEAIVSPSAFKDASVSPSATCHAATEADHPSPTEPISIPGIANDSARLLKSIETNADRNVYNAFKEKQSPKRCMNEAISMKPQALKAVEFPDECLDVTTASRQPNMQSDPGIDDTDNARSEPLLDVVDSTSLLIKEDLPKVASLPGTLDRLHGGKRGKEPVTTASGMLVPPVSKISTTGGIRRSNNPPKTLDVREVAKLQRGVFMFPNMSAESIGQCSVNLYTSGSEPSLLSRNGQRSSVTASKRTLVSGDTASSPPKTGDAPPAESGAHARLPDGRAAAMLAADGAAADAATAGTGGDALAAPSVEAKTPSYMKISCSLSGYNRYNTYTSPKQETKLRVLKLANQNGSQSSLSSASEPGSDCGGLVGPARVGDPSELSLRVTEEDEEEQQQQQQKGEGPTLNGHVPRRSTSSSSSITSSSRTAEVRPQQNGTAGRPGHHITGSSLSDLSSTTNGAYHTTSTTGTIGPAAAVVVVNGRTEDIDTMLITDSSRRHIGAKVDSAEQDEEEGQGEDARYGLTTTTTTTTNLHPSDGSGPPTTPAPADLKLQWEDKRRMDLKSAVSTPSPSKDGHYYFPIVDKEIARIRELCRQANADLESNSLPEEASGKIRTAVGKSNLLIDKKFQQFRGLCERNISQGSNEMFQTTVTDLAGFWDMVSLQISDIDTMFSDIEKMRQSGWKVVKESPVKQSGTSGGKSRIKDTSTGSSGGGSGGSGGSSKSKSVRSAKAEEAARARDEARKRLLAAKRAGRQRKASQSDKDEIEIFVAE